MRKEMVGAEHHVTGTTTSRLEQGLVKKLPGSNLAFRAVARPGRVHCVSRLAKNTTKCIGW